MKKSLPWLMLLGVLLLIGCASKKDANEKNFSEALNSYLAKKGQLCLGIPSAWPVDLNEAERRGGMGTAAEMAALEKAGLVRSHETETEYTPPLSTRPVKARVLRYELTEDGKNFTGRKPTQLWSATNGSRATSAMDNKHWTKSSSGRGQMPLATPKKRRFSIRTRSRISLTGQRTQTFREFFLESFRQSTGPERHR